MKDACDFTHTKEIDFYILLMYRFFTLLTKYKLDMIFNVIITKGNNFIARGDP